MKIIQIVHKFRISRIVRLCLAISVTVSFQDSVLAAISQPVELLEQLEKPVREEVVKVKTAKVLIADYELLRKDFSQMQNKTEAEINEWLLAKTAFVSQAQTKQTAVNTQIITDDVITHAYRPSGYNRALVFRVGQKQYIDSKGVGSLAPGQFSHGNGLATLIEATREFIMEKVVQQILTSSGLTNKTVGCYAVIDYGFRVIHPDGTQSPAGAALRQAHERYSERYTIRNGNHFLAKVNSLKIELAFRKFGLTSSGEGNWKKWSDKYTDRDVVNIQGNSKGQIFDFGAYRFYSSFTKDVYWYPEVFVDKEPLLKKSDPQFIQPDPKVMLDMKSWGSMTGTPGPRQEVLSIELAALLLSREKGFVTDQSLKNYIYSKINLNQISGRSRCEQLFK